MAVANLPFYTTSYGETFGYNERDGSNTSTFRNRYLNDGYRGTADLGPVRFNATRAQATSNLGLANTIRPASSMGTRTGSTSQNNQSQSFQQNNQSSQSLQQSRPKSASQNLESWGEYEQPRGVYTAPVQQASTSRNFSNSARFQNNDNSNYEEPSVNTRPYYVAPYEVPPSNKFAPDATALGNKTYVFNTNDENYAFNQSFRGGPAVSNRPQQDPGQSIPFGRLQSEDAKDVRLKMSLQSWDTFHVADRSGYVNYNLSGLRNQRTGSSKDPQNFCKNSISRRLEQGAQLRYQIPGYMGYIPTAQFRHGATYGKTTRQCIANSSVGL